MNSADPPPPNAFKADEIPADEISDDDWGDREKMLSAYPTLFKEIPQLLQPNTTRLMLLTETVETVRKHVTAASAADEHLYRVNYINRSLRAQINRIERELGESTSSTAGQEATEPSPVAVKNLPIGDSSAGTDPVPVASSSIAEVFDISADSVDSDIQIIGQKPAQHSAATIRRDRPLMCHASAGTDSLPVASSSNSDSDIQIIGQKPVQLNPAAIKNPPLVCHASTGTDWQPRASSNDTEQLDSPAEYSDVEILDD